MTQKSILQYPFWIAQSKDLIDALAKHEKTIDVNVDHFLNILQPYNLSWGTHPVYHPIDSEKNLPQESGNNSLFIDGVIYNWQAQQASEKLKDGLRHKLFSRSNKSASYSRNKIFNDIYHNDELISILMSDPATPYSLLGRFRSVECTPYNEITIQTRPVLVRPGVTPENEAKIYQWELAHITIEKDKNFPRSFLF